VDYTRIRIEPLSAALGAEISGVDLSSPLDDSLVAELRAAFLAHLVIFFRDQSLTPEQFLGFARTMGEPSEYPMVKGLDGYPEITEVVKKEDERLNFGGVWHSDTTYLERPPMGTMLLAREVPPVGGDTLFANMILAYESLSPGLQRLLDGLTAINSSDKDIAAATRADRIRERPRRFTSIPDTPSASPDSATKRAHRSSSIFTRSRSERSSPAGSVGRSARWRSGTTVPYSTIP
jgi:taurine dioxygenase